ncbi:uncharacterized protein LOC123543996 [Mercenaria mercenaria]|uniref:uncharacterized protein LOC123543996 n=1 Tax=Mercenaria mercenaria TaxID=6596 RepID=UPI00234EE0BC|nr:uncharacterized protein LOC123543996 [Mercenaria mercenaria]
MQLLTNQVLAHFWRQSETRWTLFLIIASAIEPTTSKFTMAYNMIDEYVPFDQNSNSGDNVSWLQQTDLYSMPTIATVQTTAENNGNGKRKRAAGNSETRKKAAKKPTAPSSQPLVASTTTYTQESTSLNHDQMKRQAQVEESKMPYDNLVLALNDFRDIHQQLGALKNKYSADTDIRQEVSSCEEQLKALVDNTEKRINQIPYCRICTQSPSTNPPKVVGSCGHEFCCISCVVSYLTRMCDAQTGKRHCLVCKEETNITIYN